MLWVISSLLILQCYMLISEKCAMYLNQNNSLQIIRFQALSGLGFNKLGKYKQCIQDNRNQYFLISGSTDLPGQSSKYFMSGICFSKLCSSNDLTYALSSIQNYVNLPFSLISIQTPSQQQVSFDIGSIFILIILGALLTIFLACSIIDLINRTRGKKISHKLLQVFSIFSTLKLLGWIQNNNYKSKQRVKIFSGIKAISLAGIFLVNLGIVAYSAPTTSAYSRNAAGSLLACFYSVDIWLMVNGFFLSYLLMKQYNKNKRIDLLIFKIIRRFTRLWPIYAITFGLNWFIVPIAGNGPIWPLMANYSQQYCGSWIPHLLMISNFTDPGCYNWLWPLQLDFQLIFYIKCRSVWASILFFVIQIFFILTSILSPVVLQGQPPKNLTAYFFHQQYSSPNILPFMRSGGFLVGYNLGILFHQFKKTQNKQQLQMIKLLQRKWVRRLSIFLGFLGLFIVLIWFSTVGQDIKSSNKQQLDGTTQAFLGALRTLVPFFIILIAIPGLFGYQSPIKFILQSKICDFISKLSLPMYSMSFTTAIYIIYQRRSDLQLSNFTLVFLTLCSIIPTMAMSLILTTIVEIPVFVLKKIYWKSQRIAYFQH